MLEIIALIFLTRRIGGIAIQKGEKPGTWKLYTVLAWFAAEIAGMALGMIMFGAQNLVGLILLGLISAVGGYLLVQAALMKKPDSLDHDIENIGR
ncbi:MAG: hypothetical protein EOP54_23275 [Sphingobacteriales bacterium]|nr:MAG: hypothetical protein EOP54_23275 [Sphingobacteriales bacterium]